MFDLYLYRDKGRNYTTQPLSSSQLLIPGPNSGADSVGEMSTIDVPTPLPSPAADADSLRKAMQGWDTDEMTLVEILARRTAPQRAEIRHAYASIYKECLVARFDSELSSHFQKAMVLLTMDPAERDAKLVRKALEERGDDRNAWVLIEASCANTPDHLIAVRHAYRFLFNSSLEEDVAAASVFQQPLRMLLVTLLRSYRCMEEGVDVDLASLEATQLADAILRKKQSHDAEVLRIVSTRSKSQLRATFDCYKKEHGSNIEQDIKNSSSQFARMLKSAIWCLTSPEKHFAEVIRYSVQGLGTDEDTLTRAIVSRADIDMINIKEECKVRFKTTVANDVMGDCSGYYKDILLALVGSED